MKDWRIVFGAVFVVLFFVSTHVFAAETYRVKKGDTIAAISGKYRVSVESLKQANKLRGNKLSINQVLIIPNSGKKNSARISGQPSLPASQKADHNKIYTVKKGDSLQKIARVAGMPVSELKSLNQLRDNTIKPGQKLVLKRHSATIAATTTKKPLPQSQSIRAENVELSNLNDQNDHIQSILESREAILADSDSSPSPPLFLGKWEDSKDKELLVKISKGFLGAPYRFGGMSLKGIDCSAFVKRVYSFFDITLPRTAREQANVGQKVSRDELVVGDLVFFNTSRYYISHVGIYIGNGQFVHASSGRNKEVRINNLSDPYYDKRFVQATRVKDGEDKL